MGQPLEYGLEADDGDETDFVEIASVAVSYVSKEPEAAESLIGAVEELRDYV